MQKKLNWQGILKWSMNY
jgi:hypothetical protein